MKRMYNQSQKQQAQKTHYDPAFWEIAVEKETLDRFANEAHLHYESEEDVHVRRQQSKWAKKLMPIIENLMEEHLTPKQRQVVRLYFIEQKTVYEISERLGISAPSVSQHLFGKARNGKVVGGAIPKLRKKFEQLHADK